MGAYQMGVRFANKHPPSHVHSYSEGNYIDWQMVEMIQRPFSEVS